MADQLNAVDKADKMVDVTKLVKYTRKIADIGSLQKMMAPMYLKDFIEAIDISSSMLAAATKMDHQADAAVKRAEAIAFLDRAGDYLKSKGIKDSAEARKKYIDIDPDVITAKDEKARTAALVVFLKHKVQEFRLAHDDVKKITYGDQQLTNWEGM